MGYSASCHTSYNRNYVAPLALVRCRNVVEMKILVSDQILPT